MTKHVALDCTYLELVPGLYSKEMCQVGTIRSKLISTVAECSYHTCKQSIVVYVLIIILQKTSMAAKSSDNPSSVVHQNKVIWQRQIHFKILSRQHVDEKKVGFEVTVIADFTL